MKHSEGSMEFREYHEKLEGLQDELVRETGLPKLWMVLDDLGGCSNGYCYVLGRPGGQRTQAGCNCLGWLRSPDHRKFSISYLKAKRELG